MDSGSTGKFFDVKNQVVMILSLFKCLNVSLCFGLSMPFGPFSSIINVELYTLNL